MNFVPKHFRDCKHTNTETSNPYNTDVILTNCSSCGKEISRTYMEAI